MWARTIDKYQCKNHFDFIKLSSNSPVNICYGLKDFFLEFYTRVKAYAGYDINTPSVPRVERYESNTTCGGIFGRRRQQHDDDHHHSLEVLIIGGHEKKLFHCVYNSPGI